MIDLNLEKEILALKAKRSKMGPKKIKARLEELYPEKYWPAASTIGDILDRNGLVIPRKRRKRVPPRTEPFVNIVNPNDSWSIDFKGWFLTGDGMKCNPLTLTDNDSRFLLRCNHLSSGTFPAVWAILDSAFREFGLPFSLRSDNGPPFASTSIGGLSRLSINLIKAGIKPEWIVPGNPQQNGRHERMHLTLQQETASPPALTLRKQENRFKDFLEYFNFERPHEAIDQKTPGSRHSISPRQWTGILKSPLYPDEYVTRTVRTSGHIKWNGHLIPLAAILCGEPIGLKETDNDTWKMYYGPVYLGTLYPDAWTRYGSKQKRPITIKY